MDVLFFLLISSMMISSNEAKWKSGSRLPKGVPTTVIETTQCSVFPHRAKCFDPIKNFRTGLPEIGRYTLQETVKTINTGPVDISGVKVSGPPVGIIDIFMGDLVIVSCKKNSDYDDTKHGPKFWKKNGRDWKNLVLDAKDIVITTRREKWTCREAKRILTRGEMLFYRIVSEHLTKEIVGDVNFPDNTFIRKIPIPRLNQDEQQMYRVVIREIKYVDSRFQSAKFEGGFLDKDGSMREENTGDFIELNKAGGNVTVFNRGPGSTGNIIYKRKPLIENDGAFKNQQSNATCDEITLDSSIQKRELFGILPEWSYSNDGESFTHIKNSDFLKKFIVTKYQMMKCQIEEMPEHTFFRVEIEYLFTEDVNEVHVTDTIEHIYKFKLPKSPTETSFGVVENFDFNPENPTDAFRFAGQVKVNRK